LFLLFPVFQVLGQENPTDGSTLTITVNNVPGGLPGIPGDNGIVELYNTAGIYLQQANTVNGVATFSNIPDGNDYSVKVFHNPIPATIFGEEYWGRKANIIVNGPASEIFVRNMPYGANIKVYKGNQDVTNQTVPIGTTLLFQVHINNPNLIDQFSRTQLIIDQNQTGSYDLDQESGNEVISTNDECVFNFYFTSDSPGDFYVAIGTTTFDGSSYLTTDGWAWSAQPIITFTPDPGSYNCKPPYPVLFIHGWAGNDWTWMNDDGNWKTYLESFGWNYGGPIHVCLEDNATTLHDTASTDVQILTDAVPANGDFFMLNFAVNRMRTLYPKVAFDVTSLLGDTLIIEPTGPYSSKAVDINIGDILVVRSRKKQILTSQVLPDEYIKVISVNYSEMKFIVERNYYNSPTASLFINFVKDHENLSSQASGVKQGMGLHEAIGKIKAATNAEKIILVCHSMGGITARQYVQSPDYTNDVAKIITVSTPHLGSNLSDIGIVTGIPIFHYDIQSDAVRDLRYSLLSNIISLGPSPPYPSLVDNAVYLFGGNENASWALDFYSKDIDGDGIEGSNYCLGLNTKPWPDNLKLHTVITEKVLLGAGLNNDLVVRCDRQYPWPDIVPDNQMDTTWNLMRTLDPLLITHNIAHRDIPNVMRGLDEPNTRNFAYEIQITELDNQFINGFTTRNSNVPTTNDSDFFKFTTTSCGTADININDFFNTSFWHTAVYDSVSGPPLLIITNTQQPGDHAHISFEVEENKTYYLCIGSEALPESYNNPYRFKVNIIPTPGAAGLISGVDSICQGSTGIVFSVPPICNATEYTWNVPAPAFITDGWNTNSITVTFPENAVSGNITVYGSNTLGNGTISSPFRVSILPVTIPTISGPNVACAGTPGLTYTTEASMSNYIWTVSPGGIITHGGTPNSNSVSITWHTPGLQWVKVNYTNNYGCMAQNPTSFDVTVHPTPVPIINGPTSLCEGVSGIAYSTAAGNTNYLWTISSGGTITSGQGTNFITVTWSTPGLQDISVNYTSLNGCSAQIPTSKNVTIHPLPVPTITGDSSICVGTIVYYLTEAGMSNYDWDISPGGVILTGFTSRAIQVKWVTAGPHTVGITYTSQAGCTAASPTIHNVTVHPLPIPIITGDESVCTGVTGLVYSTETGMSNYSWSISAGGTITSGHGTSNITVNWNSAGINAVSVAYTSANGCNSLGQTHYTVTVNPVPVPYIAGITQLCVNSGNYTYSTEAGMVSYLWTVSSGGTIIYGQGTKNLIVNWTAPGDQTVAVTYTTPEGCSATDPTIKPVTVNPMPDPAGQISGPTLICAGTVGIQFSVSPIQNAIYYVWAVPIGAAITNGANTNTITVKFLAGALPGNVTVYGHNACGNGEASSLAIDIDHIPDQAGQITGSVEVCQMETGVIYSIDPIPNTTTYEWILPTGAVIISGSGTNAIVVDFDETATSGIIQVYGINNCGSGSPSPGFSLTVNPIPDAPIITATNEHLSSNYENGNQWYRNGQIIPGATSSSYIANEIGEYWDVVTLNNCESDTSNHILIDVITGDEMIKGTCYKVFPNPTTGTFFIELDGGKHSLPLSVEIYGMWGERVLTKDLIGKKLYQISLTGKPPGIYFIRVVPGTDVEIVKIIKL